MGDNGEFIAKSYITQRAFSDPRFDQFHPLGGGRGDEFATCFSTKGITPDKGKMVLSGILSYEEPDRVKELLVLDGLDLSGFQANPICLFHHNRMAPVGLFRDEAKAFTVRRVGKRLECAAHLVQKGPQAEMAEQVFGLADTGLLNGFSLGFLHSWKAVKRMPDDPNDPYGPGVTRIEQSKAYEGSLVFIPENDRTLVTSVVRKGLSTGSGYKPLNPTLAGVLAPFAEAEGEWVLGGAADLLNPVIDKGKSVSTQTNTTESPKPVEFREVTKEVRVEVVPPEVRAAADRWLYVEKALAGGPGLPVSDFGGKLGQKALRAMHEQALFNGLAAAATADECEGPAEADVRDFARKQFALAAAMVERHKELYGEEPDWKGLSLEDFRAAASGAETADAELRAVADRARAWQVKAKGWKRAHLARCRAAAEQLKAAASLSAAPTDDQRKLLTAAAAGLDTMFSEKGLVVEIADPEQEARINELGEKIKELETSLRATRSELNKARAGAY